MNEINIYLEKVISEIINPKWALTNQILSSNKVKLIDGIPALDRYQISSDGKSIIFFFQIEDERYFLSIKVNIDKNDINCIYLENAHKCYLTVTSENLNLQELSRLTKIKYSDGWSKGDLRKNGKSIYEFSRVNFRFHEKESYSLENILIEVIEQLETDIEGINRLLKASDYCGISICRYQYVSANAGICLEGKIIKKLSDLGLGLDIDTYIVGEKIRE